MLPNIAIIVAGGSGVRMGSTVPKQFLNLSGKPILLHTLEAFQKVLPPLEIIVVMHPDFIEHWHKVYLSSKLFIPHQVIAGGENRMHSVFNGLKAVKTSEDQFEDQRMVAIHDAVRPLVLPSMIKKGMELAQKFGNSIPTISLHDSIRRINEENSMSESRESFRLVQTPQIFPFNKLLKAYETSRNFGSQDSNQEFSLSSTTESKNTTTSTKIFDDDASLYEAFGETIYLSEGSRDNIKITDAYDLELANCILEMRKQIPKNA